MFSKKVSVLYSVSLFCSDTEFTITLVYFDEMATVEREPHLVVERKLVGFGARYLLLIRCTLPD